MSAIWRVPPAAARLGKGLLDQQCWCWGQDVRHPEGNQLLARGFVRERHPSEKDLSRYTREPVRLWAFGLFFEGLWLLRQDFKARLCLAPGLPDIWTVRDAALHYPACPEEGERLRQRLRAVCQWIAEEESQVPIAWRAETLRRWDKKAVPASELSDTWRRLGETLQ